VCQFRWQIIWRWLPLMVLLLAASSSAAPCALSALRWVRVRRCAAPTHQYWCMTGVLMNQQQKMGADVGFFGPSHTHGRTLATHTGEFQCSHTQLQENPPYPLFAPPISNRQYLQRARCSAKSVSDRNTYKIITKRGWKTGSTLPYFPCSQRCQVAQ